MAASKSEQCAGVCPYFDIYNYHAPRPTFDAPSTCEVDAEKVVKSAWMEPDKSVCGLAAKAVLLAASQSGLSYRDFGES